MRTKRTCARAAIAHAAFLRRCSSIFAALQPVSLKQPFNATDPGGFQTGVSRRLSYACLLSEDEKLRPLANSHGRQRSRAGII
ncbi:MAG: hypothetical protein ACI86S_002133 [Paracoccaceae bacterium]|jgi:hypothetical protein